jgi:antitoxin component of MazEF toxin-antitoxin module
MAETLPLKLTRIGNSRGVRLPAGEIRRLNLARAGIVAEIRPDGLLLKPGRSTKLSWGETAQAMAAAHENWSDLTAASADGLDTI